MSDLALPRHRRALASLAVLVAVALAACGSTPSPTPAPAVVSPSAAAASASPSAGDASPSAGDASPSASPSDAPSASPSASPTTGKSLLGSDGRFTVLLLGSDYRPSSPGNRTDAIMVVSVNPATGATAMFSIPRDTIGFPLPEGGMFGEKVNALFQWYQSRNGNGLGSLENAISKAYGIEIDYGVLTGFAGVRNLVDAVGGLTVTLKTSYYDHEYWVNPSQQGWGLSAGTHKLNGPTALIFARSRKGDNDFGRARRQQQLVQAAVAKVLGQGTDILPTLVRIAGSTIVTDLPLSKALDLYSLVATTKGTDINAVVFGPTNYATGAGGSSFRPNLKACRAWIAKNFPPANPGAVWPAP